MYKEKHRHNYDAHVPIARIILRIFLFRDIAVSYCAILSCFVFVALATPHENGGGLRAAFFSKDEDDCDIVAIFFLKKLNLMNFNPIHK